MSASIQGQSEQSLSIASAIASHPYAFVLLVVTICCVLTRVRSGSQAHYGELHTAESVPRRIPVVPYWVPGIGHSVSFGMGFFEYLKSVAYSVPTGIFALKIGGQTHNIIISPSLTREIMNRPNLPISSDDFVYRILEKVFDDQGAHRSWNDLDPENINGLTRVLHNLMKEPFLSNAIAGTVRMVEQRTWNLVSGTPSWVDHTMWERAARVEIVSTRPRDGSFIAEADLFALSRDFLGDIATTVLMGRAFVDNNASVFKDLWLLDSKLHLMMAGLPWWMIPGGPAVHQARERLIAAVAEHHQALVDSDDGKDPGTRYGDLSDVSSLIWERIRAYRKISTDARQWGIGDLVVLWVMNVNANPTVFWLLFYVYSHPHLLEEIRNEIRPYVQLAPASESDKGFPIKPAPELKIDINRLMTECPVLRGAFFEVMRLTVASSTFRVATDDFVLSESKEDAARYGKAKPEKYLVKKGDVINIPHIVQQKSSMYYDRPDEFDARRFWVRRRDNAEKGGQEQVSVEYGNMRVWGGGKTMCKGRNFAEREVLSLVAAVFTLWDMEPADRVKGWKHPGFSITAGTYIPTKDFRVRLWRRKV